MSLMQVLGYRSDYVILLKFITYLLKVLPHEIYDNPQQRYEDAECGIKED